MTAIVIGHHKNEQGAFSPFLQASEYVYNSEVALYLEKMGFDIYNRSGKGGYKTQMQELASRMNPKNYGLVLDLHFNAFNGVANGTESLSYAGNDYTALLGRSYCEFISKRYQTTNRGNKPLTSGQNGYWFLHYQSAPALILEPFFGDHVESKKFDDAEKHACNLAEWISKI
jgi:N-acetylmuramoyl-L-alanine amidase